MTSHGQAEQAREGAEDVVPFTPKQVQWIVQLVAGCGTTPAATGDVVGPSGDTGPVATGAPLGGTAAAAPAAPGRSHACYFLSVMK